MTPLPTEFKVQNRTLKLVERRGMVALYQLFGANGLLYGYEVHLIKIAPAGKAFGKDYPEREVSPSNEDWGTLGWSFPAKSEEMARECFEQLCNRPAKPSKAPKKDDPLPQVVDDSAEEWNPFT